MIITAGPGALTCFNTAAHRCEPASITVIERGIDSGTAYVFGVEPRSATCAATELNQDYSVRGDASQVGPLSCLMTAVNSTGITLACPDHTVLIPAIVTRANTTS